MMITDMSPISENDIGLSVPIQYNISNKIKIMTLISLYKGSIILITNKTVDKKSSHNPYMQDYARFFVQFLIGS